MKKITAINILIIIISTVILFHLLIIVKIIPYDITWGGRLKNDTEMYIFESISLIINFFFISILLIKGQYLKEIMPIKIVNFFLWFFMLLFGLNTIGNLFAATNFEKYFAILTFGISCLIGFTLFKKESEST